MAVGKEIRGKIKSVENTRKITKAMEMVAASKMRKAQDRMRTARPYSDRIAAITASLSKANPEYRSPYMRDLAKTGKTGNVGFIVVTTDKGLCGGLNTNVLRAVTQKMRDVQAAGGKVSAVAIGNKGFGFLNRAGANVVSHVTQLGDAPNLDRLIGPVKVMLEQFVEGKLDAVHLCFNRFVNTMKQEPTVTALLPLTADGLQSAGAKAAAEGKGYAWDYIYEPDAAVVIDELLKRYIEALVYQAVAENMASEQAARMVAMKAATDNAGNLIAELKLIYNKTRQAAITKELSEIVGGAAAV
ncbi:MAG TPA: F0F1 ATP synthase subunit gamma [Burkholderiaceae bacterium]|nr:F0F1 ATP synthase subunit gamma [Burkholderiaceae bacterium]